MPRGNRGDFPKTGLITGIIVSAIIAALFIGWGYLESAKYEREAHNEAGEYATYTNQQIRQSCLGPTVRDKADCVTEARHKQRENEREEYDLVAQRKSALWAYIMAAAAVIGMGLSVIGVYLVWTTFREQKEANRIANREAQRSELEAAAMRRHIIQTERAVVSIDRTNVQYADEWKWIELSLDVRNGGKSNAWNLQIFTAIQQSREFPKKFHSSTASTRIVHGGAPATTDKIRVRAPRHFPAYVFGYLHYTTAHEASFKSFFCVRLDGVPKDDGHGGEINSPVDARGEVQLPSNS